VSYVSSRMNRSGNDVIGPNEFDPEAPALRLVGTCRDVAGRVHRVDISVDLVHRWEHGLPAATVKLLADEAAEAGIAPP